MPLDMRATARPGRRQHSPSPLRPRGVAAPRCAARSVPAAKVSSTPRPASKGAGAARDRAALGDALALPGAAAPHCAVHPQGLVTQHTFVAMCGGSLACLSGNLAVMCYSDGSQRPRFTGYRCRPLACCALSHDGRFLAVGEACSARDLSAAADVRSHGGGPQVLVFDLREGLPVRQLRGPACGSQMVAWSSRSAASGAVLLAVSAEEGDQGEQQLTAWSWPEGERLQTAASLSHIVDLSFSPDGSRDCFCTVGPSEAKVWSLTPPGALTSRSKSSSAGEWRLSSRALQVCFPVAPPGSLLGSGGRGSASGRRPHETMVGVAWGTASWIYFLSRSGSICALSAGGESAGKSAVVGRRGCALIWAERLCGRRPGPLGLLAVALAGGTVEILDCEDLTRIAAISAGPPGGGIDAVGLSCSPATGEALWVLCKNRKLRRWRNLDGDPDYELPAPLCGLRSLMAVPHSFLPHLVTSSDHGLHLWSPTVEGIRLDRGEQDANMFGGVPAPAPGCITAMASAPQLVAVGYDSGHLRLVSVPGMDAVEAQLPRHRAEVRDLSFVPWQLGSQAPLLLASGSQDGSIMVLRLSAMDGASWPSACSASLLWRYSAQEHAAPAVSSVAILGGGGAVSVLAAFSDRHLRLIEGLDAETPEELSPRNAPPRPSAEPRSLGALPRGARWVGVCAQPARGLALAAASDGRVSQLDASGRIQQQVRVLAHGQEFAPPLRLTDGGGLLAIALAPARGRGHAAPPSAWPEAREEPRSPSGLAQQRWASVASAAKGAGAAQHGLGGIILLDASGELRPLVRLVGYSEPAVSFTFLDDREVLACWPDGAMLLWKYADRVLPPPGDVEAQGAAEDSTDHSIAALPTVGPATSSGARSPLQTMKSTCAAAVSPRRNITAASVAATAAGSPPPRFGNAGSAGGAGGSSPSSCSGKGNSSAVAARRAMSGLFAANFAPAAGANSPVGGGSSRAGGASPAPGGGGAAAKSARHAETVSPRSARARPLYSSRSDNLHRQDQASSSILRRLRVSSKLPSWAQSGQSQAARLGGSQLVGLAALAGDRRQSNESATGSCATGQQPSARGSGTLGRWAQGSQVGSQVHSAADLLQVPLHEECPRTSITGSAASLAGVDRRSSSTGTAAAPPAVAGGRPGSASSLFSGSRASLPPWASLEPPAGSRAAVAAPPKASMRAPSAAGPMHSRRARRRSISADHADLSAAACVAATAMASMASAGAASSRVARGLWASASTSPFERRPRPALPPVPARPPPPLACVDEARAIVAAEVPLPRFLSLEALPRVAAAGVQASSFPVKSAEAPMTEPDIRPVLRGVSTPCRSAGREPQASAAPFARSATAGDLGAAVSKAVGDDGSSDARPSGLRAPAPEAPPGQAVAPDDGGAPTQRQPLVALWEVRGLLRRHREGCISDAEFVARTAALVR